MGTNCSLFGSAGCCCCARATPAMSTASMARPHHIATLVPLCIPLPPFIDCPGSGLIRKRPETEFFLGRVPQTCQTIGLDDEKDNDQAPEDHQLNIRNQVRRHGADKQCGGVVDQYG